MPANANGDTAFWRALHASRLTRLPSTVPQYQGRTTFMPGLIKYVATKPWTGFPMAALQRAITMTGKLNSVGIPHDTIFDSRSLQDIYTKPINLDEVLDGDDGESDAELDGDRVTPRQIESDKGQKTPGDQENPKTSDSQNPIALQRALEGNRNAAFEGRTNEMGFKDKPNITQSAIQKRR